MARAQPSMPTAKARQKWLQRNRSAPPRNPEEPRFCPLISAAIPKAPGIRQM